MRIFLFEEEVKRRPGTTPARPEGAQVPSPTDNPVTPSFIILVLSLILLPFVLYYTYQWTQAGTTINTTITENDDLNNGLIGHWTFDGPDINGSTVINKGSTGTTSNGTRGSVTRTTPVVGKIGQGLRFDGSTTSGAVVSTPTGSSLATPTYGTYSAWIYTNGDPGHKQNILHENNACQYDLSLAQGTMNLQWQTCVTRDSGYRVATNTWTFVAATVNNGTLTMYANGEQVYQNTANVAGGSMSTFIGASDISGTNAFNGTLDDVRVYNRTLSAREVKRLYEMGATTHINTTITENDDLSNGLVGHWTFDGPNMAWASTTAEVLDSSASSIEGNMINMSQQSVTSGKIGQALVFDGLDDNIDLGTSTPIRFDTTGSISAWIKTDCSDVCIIVGGNSTTEYSGYNFFINFGVLTFRSDKYHVLTTPWVGVYDDGSWHHVVITKNGTTGIVYVDNEVKSSTASLSYSAPWSTNSIYIGNEKDRAYYFQGAMDDVRIYNRAISASEVKRLYEMGATTHINTTIDTNDELENGLVGHWTFDGPKMAWANPTAEVLDSSASSIEGDMTNMNTSNATAGKIGQGLQFDGVDDYIDIPDTAELDLTSAATVSLWFKLTTAATEYDGLLMKTYTDAWSDGYGLYFTDDIFASSTQSLVFFIRVYNGAGGNAAAAFKNMRYDRVDGVWHHAVGVFDGTAARIYVDNIQGTSDAYTGSITTNVSQLFVGKSRGTAGAANLYTTPVQIDDVRIYNRALSAAEVKRLYELGGGQ